MKKHIIAVALVCLLMTGLAMAASSKESPQQADVSILAVPDPVPGDMFTGNYLRIGINNAGTLGITNGTNTGDPGVGFQWAGDVPFMFPSTESLAWEWWGEGYKIAYKEREKKKWVDTVAYYQPGYGYPPLPETNIALVSQKVLLNDEQKAVKEIKVRTKDKKLLITFTFTFLKEYPELNLETTVTNIGYVPVRDVVYTRIVDWDVCTDIINTWASTGHEAYAWNPCLALAPAGEPAPIVQLTVSGHDGAFKTVDDYDGSFGTMSDHDGYYRNVLGLLNTPLPVVNYVDLYAWDDETVRSPGFVVQSFEPVPSVDYNAGIYYKLGELKPKESKTVYTVYQSNFPMAMGMPTKADAPPVIEEQPSDRNSN